MDTITLEAIKYIADTAFWLVLAWLAISCVSRVLLGLIVAAQT